MNKRRFRVRDNVLLLNTYQKVVQIADKIEDKCDTESTVPYRLPKSIVPTDILYDMSVCFLAMYDKLLEEELIQDGYPKSTNTQH